MKFPFGSEMKEDPIWNIRSLSKHKWPILNHFTATAAAVRCMQHFPRHNRGTLPESRNTDFLAGFQFCKHNIITGVHDKFI